MSMAAWCSLFSLLAFSAPSLEALLIVLKTVLCGGYFFVKSASPSDGRILLRWSCARAAPAARRNTARLVETQHASDSGEGRRDMTEFLGGVTNEGVRRADGRGAIRQ